jgi:hypothetical protein
MPLSVRNNLSVSAAEGEHVDARALGWLGRAARETGQSQ